MRSGFYFDPDIVPDAPRITTSGCSRQRASASKLASALAADPRRLYMKENGV